MTPGRLEAEIHRRLADDRWQRGQRLLTVSVEPWTILSGAERLASARTSRSVGTGFRT